MSSHGYTFTRWKEDDALGWFPTNLPTYGVYTASSADASVKVQYAFGEDAAEAKDDADTVDQLNDAIAALSGDPPSKHDTQITANVAYWWSTDWGSDKDTVKGCLSRAGTTTPVPPKIGLCKKPGIHYKGKTEEGVKVCFTLSPDGTELIQSGWILSRTSGSDCSGIPPGALPGSTTMLDNHPTRTSGQHFDTGVLSGTIRDATGALLSTATGMLSDPINCPSKTFKWSAQRAP